ncbi:hypothetical protein [Actinomadura litoris]|uniref:hypothetical protein n=1 Tax=Actinomadura litoris TaxID=2678616 RepID=UPI001FA7F3DB|nr:hypothetical protein [Actinomadura litoris]
MAHNSNCARARLPGCKCECGGAMHACQGAFEIAGGTEKRVREYLAEQEGNWDTRPPGVTLKQAAIGCARADVVYWLYRDGALRRCARSADERAFEVAPGVSDGGLVLRGLSAHLGAQRMQEFQVWARSTHFWCELLAQIAHAITQYQQLRDKIFRTAEEALRLRSTQPLADELRCARAIEVAVWSAWRYLFEGIISTLDAGTSLRALLNSGDVAPLLWPIRVLAVLMCPDASGHPAVRRYCWDPIVRHGGAEVRQKVRERLTQMFPDDPWFA